MPGGKIAFGEHVEDAAVREAREETGLDVKFVGIRGIASEIVHNKGAKKDHFMLYVCELATDDRTFKEGQEGDLKWFDLQEIDAYAKEITPSDLLMIKKFILSKQSVPVYKVKMIEDGEGYFVESFA